MSEDSDLDENDQNVGFLFKAMRNRDPRKRKVKPVSRHLMQVNFGGDDSDNDSDYQVKMSDMSEDEGAADNEPEEDMEDCEEESEQSKSNSDKNEDDEDSEGSKGKENSDDNDDDSDDDDDDDDSDGDDSDDEASDEGVGNPKRNYFENINSDDDDEDYVPRKKQKTNGKRIKKPTEKQRIRSSEVSQDLEEPSPEDSSSSRPVKVIVCCVCLGDISESDDEIVECDNCGVAVHEGCYGISDNQSAASSESSASTEPWFCDACKAGVKPDCELCPNEGGIFKETDAGKWVHLVCALYTPGVAFGDVDKLSPVTLFEMPYSKWGLRECSLCEDSRFSRTGVCVSCDAGMCRSYFHVTCAQRNGLLSEASPDEDIADPFYAYCKLHADKITMRAKRRNYLAIQSHMRHHAENDILDEREKVRFRRKLMKHRQKYNIAKAERPPSWVPPQKLVRFLTSSPSVVKKMLRKAELMGIITQSTHVVHATEKQQERKKSHTGPALSTEYVTYYLDRNVRIEKMKADLRELEKQHVKLRKQDATLRQQYDQLLKDSSRTEGPGMTVLEQGQQLWALLSDLAENPLPMPSMFVAKKSTMTSAKKEVVRSPTAVINQCGKCGLSHDQHLLAKCDMCHLWYHLACLEPPLTRMPKKTSRWGWQCSECARSSSEESEDSSCVNVNAPRRLREKIKEPAKISQQQMDMEFLFPSMGKKKGKKTGSKDSRKKSVSSKSKSSKNTETRKKKTPLETTIQSEESNSVPEIAQSPNEESPSRDSPIDGTTGESPVGILYDDDNDDDYPIDEETGVGSPIDGTAGNSPSLVDLSDDSSMEVQIHIEEQSTPIGKHSMSHNMSSVSRTGRKIIKKRHYDDDSDDSDVSPMQHCSTKIASPDRTTRRRSASKTPPEKSLNLTCVTCSKLGDKKNMVSCDSCEQYYHFRCLDPPSKKTPKQRGYTWFCEACDIDKDSDNEEDN
ncbi:PHD finger protein 14-like isoform X2 [Mya arenaria]|uniref:PHD finger protein 14-like isoform X2 n=1 Tax=Mya arenaria TaxID=6604 RepID=UPI0022E5DEBB|nr:PHD finger protein 14-like isoform X2 [Mya arenaria]